MNFIFGNMFLVLLSKVFFLTIDLLFTVFLIVVLKQVLSMNTVIDDPHDALSLKLGAFSLFIIGLSLFLTGIVIL
jgi:hypothetical protein